MTISNCSARAKVAETYTLQSNAGFRRNKLWWIFINDTFLLEWMKWRFAFLFLQCEIFHGMFQACDNDMKRVLRRRSWMVENGRWMTHWIKRRWGKFWIDKFNQFIIYIYLSINKIWRIVKFLYNWLGFSFFFLCCFNRIIYYIVWIGQ